MKHMHFDVEGGGFYGAYWAVQGQFKLCRHRLYQTEFTFIYEKFDLYRSLTIPVVWLF